MPLDQRIASISLGSIQRELRHVRTRFREATEKLSGPRAQTETTPPNSPGQEFSSLRASTVMHWAIQLLYWLGAIWKVRGCGNLAQRAQRRTKLESDWRLLGKSF